MSKTISKINYFNYMLKPGNYGTFTELLAATEIFGFIGYVIQSINELLNDNKPVVYLLFTGPPDNGHFRILMPKRLDYPQIHTGSYKRTESQESNLILITNIVVKPSLNNNDRPEDIEQDVMRILS